MKTVTDYRDILEAVIKMQIAYIKEDMGRADCDEYEERYEEGKIVGLQIALQKIEDANFLIEE